MRMFKTKRKRIKVIEIYLTIIVVIVTLMLQSYNSKVSDKIIGISKDKLEEITTLYIKKNITPKGLEFNKLINVNINKDGEIIYVDIDNDYARNIMVDIVGKIQQNIFELEKGNIKGFENNNELKSYKGKLYIEVPMLISEKGVIFSNIGAKIPVKLSFYEHVLGNVDTKITEYGINNALVTVYMSITLEQKIIVPYLEEKIKHDYSIVLGSKIINGKVPSLYNGVMNKTSSVLEV